MFVVGFTFLLLASPGLGMIFINSDDIFPTMFGKFRVFGIVWGGLATMVALILIFCGIRSSATPGTRAYRLTHPWEG